VPAGERKEILGMIRAGGKKVNVRHIVALVERHGGIDYAMNRAREFARTAQRRLEVFPDSPSHRSLNAFADFVIEREK
jgi:geranylgeranyl pyrophosphate synthase